jgi:hypothetical protein
MGRLYLFFLEYISFTTIPYNKKASFCAMTNILSRLPVSQIICVVYVTLIKVHLYISITTLVRFYYCKRTEKKLLQLI